MSIKYVFDDDDLCYRDENKDIVYCNAGGCEAPALELVGESELPLCGMCADVWWMGYNAGKEAAEK